MPKTEVIVHLVLALKQVRIGKKLKQSHFFQPVTGQINVYG
jgi:hypothetical protein